MSTSQPTRTVTLRPIDHQTLFGAQLAEACIGLSCAEEELGTLQETADRAAGVRCQDARSYVARVREDLDALDALGWPDDPYTG